MTYHPESGPNRKGQFYIKKDDWLAVAGLIRARADSRAAEAAAQIEAGQPTWQQEEAINTSGGVSYRFYYQGILRGVIGYQFEKNPDNYRPDSADDRIVVTAYVLDPGGGEPIIIEDCASVEAAQEQIEAAIDQAGSQN